jgi:hypothetical protein
MATRPRDDLVVETAPLASLLREFVAAWGRERPPRRSGRFGDGGARSRSQFVSPVSWLAAESGLSVPVVENVVRARSPVTPLRTADALLVGALERPDLLAALEVRRRRQGSRPR